MTQTEAIRGDSNARCGRARERCQRGPAVFRDIAEGLDFGRLDLEVRCGNKGLPDGSMVGEDDWAVPAWFTGPVLGCLVKHSAPTASDGEPRGHMARWFAGASQDLFFAQYEPGCGGEADGPGLALSRPV
ncbi:hypothetical protein [Streptomyces sp. NPDC088137]|uniref:hypothetical protein n=1 Tax=Streptomyces sp. NPDC088137 TaxID=3365827 RepID=UPI003809FA84